MADRVVHWPSRANWYARDSKGHCSFYTSDPRLNEYYGFFESRDCYQIDEWFELVEIDPATPWQESKQRRPE